MFHVFFDDFYLPGRLAAAAGTASPLDAGALGVGGARGAARAARGVREAAGAPLDIVGTIYDTLGKSHFSCFFSSFFSFFSLLFLPDRLAGRLAAATDRRYQRGSTFETALEQ